MNLFVKKSEEKWGNQAVVWEMYLFSDLVLRENESVCRMMLKIEVGRAEEGRPRLATGQEELVEQPCDVSKREFGMEDTREGKQEPNTLHGRAWRAEVRSMASLFFEGRAGGVA